MISNYHSSNYLQPHKMKAKKQRRNLGVKFKSLTEFEHKICQAYFIFHKDLSYSFYKEELEKRHFETDILIVLRRLKLLCVIETKSTEANTVINALKSAANQHKKRRQ